MRTIESDSTSHGPVYSVISIHSSAGRQEVIRSSDLRWIALRLGCVVSEGVVIVVEKEEKH